MNVALLIVAVVLLLVTAVSVTMIVTRESTIREVAAANAIDLQLARSSSPSGYAQTVNGQATNQGAASQDNVQPYIPANSQGTVNSSANDYGNTNGGVQASCHSTGSQIGSNTGTAGTQSYGKSGGCGGGRCGGR